MIVMQLDISSKDYTSSNLRKHSSANPVQQHLIGRFHQRALDLLTETNATSILDAGCGEGFAMRELLRNHAAWAIGLDGSAAALQLATRLNSQRSFVAGDLLSLPFPDRSFDLVLCMEVLEHLADPLAGLHELCRVSRQWLLLTVPNEPFFRGANFLRGKNIRDWGNDPGHVNHWSTNRFRAFVSSRCHVVTWQRSFPWTLVLCSVA